MKNFRKSLPVWLTFLLAVIALAGGLIVGTQIKSPAQIAAESRPPEPGLITTKVEQRQLTAQITTRADIMFADPVTVSPTVPAGAEAAVVTGRIPNVGDTIEAGSVILEVSGRPVFVLPGEFPAYRTLMPGLVGPDVQQLRTALSALGYSAGATSQAYDEPLANAVEEFYDDAGYPAPGSDDLSKAQAVRDARDALSDAQDVQTQAVLDYNTAQEAASAAANNVIDSPNIEAAENADSATSDPSVTSQVETMASSPPDLSSLKQAITVADRGVARATEALADAQQAALATVPTGEIIFVTDLPRRVDAVNLSLGQTLGGTGTNGQQPAIVVSGANIAIIAHIPEAQSNMVEQGSAAIITDSSGTKYAATVAERCSTSETSTICDAHLALDDPSSVDRDALLGNVKVSITIGTSSIDSLVVPVAAVSVDSDGQAQVQLVTGPLLHNQPISDQPTEIVKVDIGLSAEGYIEIKPLQTDLHPGDLVVIGINASEVEATAEPSPR